MAQNKTLELSIKIAGKVDKSLTTAINQTNTLMGSLTTTMSKVGTAGLAAMGALATATVAGLAKCTSEAAKLENNMSAMVRYVDGLTESATTSTEQAQSNLKAMRTYIQDLSTQIPRTTEQISKMSAALGQSGIGADRQMSTGILRDTAVAATAMDLEDDTAGNYMAKWEAAFNFNHDQVMTLMDQINYLGANNATTAAEIAQSVNQAASMGQIAGVDPSATAAIATAMQATGVATDRVGTSISRIYTNISKGSNATKAQKAMWEELGFTAEGIARSMQSDGIGTLKSVFQAINNMPDERKVAALNTLFGQWAIEGGAKITHNLALLEKTLGEVNDPGLYTGSMEREFLIEASTPEAVDIMLSNAKAALMQDIGQAFLPAKKEFSLSMIDFLNQIRKNMPELTTLANSLGKIASDGVERLGDAMERALPYIQKGLDYLANNGPQVASTLGKLAAVFVGMKFAPGIESLLSGAGSLLLGSSVGGSGKRTGGLLGGIKSLFQGGQKAAGTAGGFLSTFGGAASGNGFSQTLGSVASSLISGNGIKGTAGLLEAAAGTPGLLSGYQGAGSALKNRIAGSGIGQYFGSVFSSLGSFGSTLGNTKTGGFLSGLLGKAGGALGNLTMPLRQGIAGIGAATTIQGSIIQQNLSGLLGKAGGFVSGIANSGAGKAIGGVLGSLGTVAKSGAGVLGTVWGPIASGFGSIFAGAAPVIGVISSIIAVVSILGDHLEDIRGIIQNVFGDTGVAVFDSAAKRGQLHHGTVCGRRRGKCTGPAAGDHHEPVRRGRGRGLRRADDHPAIGDGRGRADRELCTDDREADHPGHFQFPDGNRGAHHPANLHSGGSVYRWHHQRPRLRHYDGYADHRLGHPGSHAYRAEHHHRHYEHRFRRGARCAGGYLGTGAGHRPHPGRYQDRIRRADRFHHGRIHRELVPGMGRRKADIRRRVRRAGGPAENAGERGDRADQQGHLRHQWTGPGHPGLGAHHRRQELPHQHPGDTDAGKGRLHRRREHRGRSRARGCDQLPARRAGTEHRHLGTGGPDAGRERRAGVERGGRRRAETHRPRRGRRRRRQLHLRTEHRHSGQRRRGRA